MIKLNGLTLGNMGTFAVPWWKVTDHNLDDSPEVRSTQGDRYNEHGGWSTPNFMKPRYLTITGMCEALTLESREGQKRRLHEALGLGVVPLEIMIGDQPRFILVKTEGKTTIQNRGMSAFKWSVQLRADDPLYYSGDPRFKPSDPFPPPGWQVISVGLPSSSGGVTFPYTYPFTFGGFSSSGDIAFNNPGNLGKAYLKIMGPITDPSITWTDGVGNTGMLKWSLSLAADEFLWIDPYKHIALLSGQSSRPPVIAQWPTISRGLNTFRFRAPSYSAGMLYGYFLPAW